MRQALLLVILSAVASAQPRYDLLLKGGHVIDPRNNLNRLMDVAITADRIARVAPSIAAAEAKKVVDVKSLYVTPPGSFPLPSLTGRAIVARPTPGTLP